MQDWNKQNLIAFGVVALCCFVGFFSLISFVACVEDKVWWAFPIPCAAIVYGCYTFVKKYYPKNNTKKD